MPRAIESAARLTLTQIRPGSTVLEFEIGQPNTLDLSGGIDEEIANRFEAMLAGLATNTPPEWAGTELRSAAAATAKALKGLGARRLTLTAGTRELADVSPASIDEGVWRVPAEMREDTTASGELFAVDLHKNTFRIADDLGNAISLDGVEGSDEAARLIARRVVATGVGEFDASGGLKRISVTNLRAFDLPDAWRRPEPHGPLQPGTGSGPGVADLTDQEIDEFLASL